MRNTKIFGKLPFIAVLVAGVMNASWATDHSAWKYYQTLTIKPDTAVKAAVTNFPVLITLTSANAAVFTNSRADGFDVRFSDQTGTNIPFQRQSYSKTAQTAEFWVKVPSIAASPASTPIIMYWDDSLAADSSSTTATFSAAAGYRGVWHMSADTGANELDATGTGHDLVPTASPTITAGPVGLGKAKNFDGSTQFFVAKKSGGTGSTLNMPAGGPLTISAWINPSSDQTCNAILGKINSGNCGPWVGSYGWLYSGSTTNMLRFNDEIGAPGFERSYYMVTSSTWQHIVWVRSGTGSANSLAYVNGVSAGTPDTSYNTKATSRNDTLDFTIAADAAGDSTHKFWGGAIQEVQVIAAAWSASQAHLAYLNQSNAAGLITFGAIDTTVIPPPNATRPQYQRLPISQILLAQKGGSLEYVVPRSAGVHIAFMDIRGKMVLELNRTETLGKHTLDLDKTNLSAGAYIASVKSDGLESKLMVNIAR